MNRNNLFIWILTIVLSFAFSLSANAQLKYAEGRFTVDSSPYGSYKMTVGGNGAYFKMPTGGNFFQIDITQDNTRLAGHNDQIVFYNSTTNKYNNISVQNVYYHSDARSKTNIQNFTNGLNVITQLRPVTYNFIDSQSGGGNSALEIGLLAQELEEILPNAVVTDGSGMKLVNYNALIPVLIDAVKTLQQEVETLKANQRQ